MRRVRWFEERLAIQLDNLTGYARLMEETLEASLARFKEQIESAASTMSDDEKDEYYEFYADDHWQLADVFPNTLRYSLLVTCYSTMEHHLASICRYLHKRHPVVGLQPARETLALKQASYYLKRSGRVDMEALDGWADLNGFRMTRNTIVHNDGIVDTSRVERFVVHTPGMMLDRDKKLILAPELHPAMLASMRRFSKALHDKLDHWVP